MTKSNEEIHKDRGVGKRKRERWGKMSERDKQR